MPAMAGDWPRAPRAYPSPQTAPTAPLQTLPGVAELLSSRPSAPTVAADTMPAYRHHQHQHQQQHHHRQNALPLHAPPAAAATTAATTTTAAAPAAPYWHPVSHRQTSPPVSPTEQRPLERLHHEPQFRREPPTKEDAPLHHPASSGAQPPSQSALQARQDSAIDHHRFESGNNALPSTSCSTSSSSSTSSFRHSPKHPHTQLSPALPSHHPAGTQPFSTQAGTQRQARQHSKSASSSTPYSAMSPASHDHSTSHIIPVHASSGSSDSRVNGTGPPSFPENPSNHQNGNGNGNGSTSSSSANNTNNTRQQRYNVRFAANYTSENMPPSQKPRNDPPTPPAAPATPTETEQPTSSPAPVTTTDDAPAHTANATSGHVEPQQRPARDRTDREPSPERCPGCNETWTRPIPDLDSQHMSPAETNEQFRQMTSNMIERLRKQIKMVDAAHDDWKWRHSRCIYRPTSPSSTGSADGVSRPLEPVYTEGSTHNPQDRKRKSVIPHEPHSASKQQRVTGTSPAPPVRQPDLS